MERLTIRNSDGSVSQPTGTTVYAVFYRLAAYEDTGLTPEEIKAVIEDASKEFLEYDELMPKHRVKELAQAEKDGRLVVLPDRLKKREAEDNEAVR